MQMMARSRAEIMTAKENIDQSTTASKKDFVWRVPNCVTREDALRKTPYHPIPTLSRLKNAWK